MPAVTRHYEIDLDASPGKRWARMIRAEKARARKLVDQSMADAVALFAQGWFGGVTFAALRRLVPAFARWLGKNTEYYEDIEAWAADADLDRNDLTLVNLTYELSSGCTAAAFDLPAGQGVAHLRNMDWAMVGVGPHTCAITYLGPCGPFTTLGWPGWVGVLSGMAPKRYSVTLNQAPQDGLLPDIAWPSAFALRYAFENCATYEDAIADLMDTDLCRAALFLYAGTEPGEAAVIEHPGQGDNAVRRDMKGGALAVANHYMSPELRDMNDDDNEDSQDRGRCALEAVRKASRKSKAKVTANGLLKVLSAAPVLNEMTAQKMAFVPASGQCAFLYHDTDAAVEAWFEDNEEEEDQDEDQDDE
ncbi:MAG: acid ceramidase family protein [Nitrospira sp.]|nr:acid ceramidase family protein [Nitrospira sp.]